VTGVLITDVSIDRTTCIIKGRGVLQDLLGFLDPWKWRLK